MLALVRVATWRRVFVTILASRDEAFALLEVGTFDGTESGHFRILSVATLAPAGVAA